MKHSRKQPSARYLEYVDMYKQLHRDGVKTEGIAAEDTFPGISLPVYAAIIGKIIRHFHAKSILDYGSGKGKQYTRTITEQDIHNFNLTSPAQTPFITIPEYWGVQQVTCYDPAFPPFSELPKGKFDGVITTDMLEHCTEEDIPWILDEIAAYAKKFVFANIACYPAGKTMPNGENAHCTVRPIEWWVEHLRKLDAKYGHLYIEFSIIEAELENGKHKLHRTTVNNKQIKFS